MLKANGCGRVSINPQTLNDSVLEAIGRKHTTAQFFDSFDLARKVGFNSIKSVRRLGLNHTAVERTKNDCPVYSRCGGCCFRHMF